MPSFIRYLNKRNLTRVINKLIIHAQQHVLVTAIILAIILISSIHIFLLPKYTSNPVAKPMKLASYEQELCEDASSLSVRLLHKDQISCPKHGIVSAVQSGRLGNQIWDYLSIWAVARYDDSIYESFKNINISIFCFRKTKLEPFVPTCVLRTLQEYFENLSLLPLSNIKECIIDTSQIVHKLADWNSKEQNIILPK